MGKKVIAAVVATVAALGLSAGTPVATAHADESPQDTAYVACAAQHGITSPSEIGLVIATDIMLGTHSPGDEATILHGMHPNISQADAVALVNCATQAWGL